MSHNDDSFPFLVFLLLTLAAGFALGIWCCNKSWEKSSIEAGFAEYNQVTGLWQWKPNLSEENNDEK